MVLLSSKLKRNLIIAQNLTQKTYTSELGTIATLLGSLGVP
jgi:hypothetical protein